jgi:hypothetical protein
MFDDNEITMMIYGCRHCISDDDDYQKVNARWDHDDEVRGGANDDLDAAK